MNEEILLFVYKSTNMYISGTRAQTCIYLVQEHKHVYIWYKTTNMYISGTPLAVNAMNKTGL